MFSIFEKIIDLLVPSEWMFGFDENKPPRIKGTVSRSFVREAGDLLRKAGIPRARIYGVKKRGTVTLAFSGSIAKNLHQKLRNLWAAHRG